ncbi:MAG TPA: hypothetical protein VMF65_23775 [Acidimicrobiales bacterium]|nr:hypothetical protein [Acidimicrobiales bacterium]
MRADLSRILVETVRLGEDVGGSPTWADPLRASRAGTELAEEEADHPQPETGSWPWLLTLRFSRLALKVAADEARWTALVIADATSTSYAIDVLSRAVLEATSLVWWLLDPEIPRARRSARMLLYRLNGAREADKADRALRAGVNGAQAAEWEPPERVREEIRDYGFALSHDDKSVTWDEEKEFLPGYTDRTSQFVKHVWSGDASGFAYRFLSAVAHAEVLGLVRNVELTGGADHLQPEPFWIWFDTYLTVGSLVLANHRAADFLGLKDCGERLSLWADYAQSRLQTLQPPTPPRA